MIATKRRAEVVLVACSANRAKSYFLHDLMKNEVPLCANINSFSFYFNASAVEFCTNGVSNSSIRRSGVALGREV